MYGDENMLLNLTELRLCSYVHQDLDLSYSYLSLLPTLHNFNFDLNYYI